MLLRLTACFFLLFFFEIFSFATAAPVETSTAARETETIDCNNDTEEVYDQRQNGTENYRIHVNGVVFLVAPAETVLQAAQLGSLQMGGDAEPSLPTKPKPKPTVEPTESHQQEPTVIHPKDYYEKNNLKLLNLLHMFRSVRHDAEGMSVHLPTE